MDVTKILNVKTLNDYIAATETIVQKCPNLNIQLNMSAVLNLKKVRSLEIEYFIKCGCNGAAIVVFERMLEQPPSKTWGLLGKELVTILQYWLDAVSGHLIDHSQNWWIFLKTLLEFIKSIKSKAPSLLETVVELTAAGMLAAASHERLDAPRRQLVLRALNEACAASGRGLRARLGDRLAGYFVRLGGILAGCGHLPTQLGVLETLLRWLVGRRERRARAAAAAAWLPPALFREETVRLFLERPWRDFYQDARDFLNSHNAHRPGGVTSVACKRLSIGGVDIINSRATWLDVNAPTRTVSVILDARALRGAADDCYETLTIAEQDTSCVRLYRSASETVLELQPRAPPPEPAGAAAAPAGARALLARAAAARLRDLDAALRAVFGDKYQVLLNFDAVESSPSSDAGDSVKDKPPNFKKFSSSEEDRQPVILSRRRKNSGYIVRSRNQLPWNSPSSASTTSLAQLHDKLAALPHLVYSKEAVKVSVRPELSAVSEASERDSRVGVIHRQSETDLARTNKRNLTANIKRPSTLLLSTAINSTDESVINDTYEKIYNNNQEIDLLDLLVKEALHEQERDSGILPDKQTQDAEVIENTPVERQVRRKRVSRVEYKSKTKCTVVSNSTTDESNTEFANPCYVSDRKNRLITKDNNKANVEQSKLLDAEAVDAFFSQHTSENAAGQLVISPSLAKKINETSSETSDIILDEDPNLNKDNLMIEIEVIDCLNDIVDEVARSFDKCTEMLNKEHQELAILENVFDVNIDQNMNEVLLNVSKENTALNTTPKPGPLRLKLSKKSAPKKTKSKKIKQNKVNISMIEEEQDDVLIENTDTNSPVKKLTTPLIRKKRKLYSPKDDNSDQKEEITKAEVEPRKSNTDKTYIATCYKDLEIARITRSKIPRKKRASTVPITSPKTKKLNDIFDKLKEKVDNEEKITQVNTKSNTKNSTVYNFTSESEDEDFKKKEVKKKKSVDSKNVEITATKRGRLVNRVKYTDSNYNSSTDENSRKPKKRKVVKQRKLRSRRVNMDRSTDLVDERIREAAPETLEISFVRDTPSKHKDHELEPSIEQAPVMEAIPNDRNDTLTEVRETEHKTQMKKKVDLQMKRNKRANKHAKAAETLAVNKEKELNINKTATDVSCNKDSESDSPLPGLVVETEKSREDDMTASVEATMLQKFHKIYKEGPDVDESDGTQNLLLRAEKYNSPSVSNKGVILEMFDRLDAIENIATNNAENNAFDPINQNQNRQEEQNIVETILLSDAPSEKSIATFGHSPITGHNDLDESPPNVTSLKENIEERNLEIEDMSPAMADFFLQLRNRLQAKTTPRASSDNSQTSSSVLPTRLSSKKSATTPHRTESDSTPKTRKCSVMLTRHESGGRASKSSVSSHTPEVVLERLSSDEINKWLPMPCSSRTYMLEEVTTRYNTRYNAQKSKKALTKTPIKKGENTTTSIISPIRLTFDNDDNINSDKCNASLEDLDSSHRMQAESREASKELHKTKSIKLDSQKSQAKDIVQSICKMKGWTSTQHSNFENKSPAEERSPRETEINTDQSAGEKRKLQSVHSSEEGKSIASVNEWFKRNIVASSCSKGDSEIGKEIVEKVMETLSTTLEEIQQETGKNLASMLVENQRSLNSLRERVRALDAATAAEIVSTANEKWAEIVATASETITSMANQKWAERDGRVKEMMEKYEKDQNNRAIEVASTVHGRTNLMVRLLKEDLQAVLDFNMKKNK